MRIIEGAREVEVNYSPLLEDLLVKWSLTPIDRSVHVDDINKITSELSAWGIPWKRVKWSYE